jgi:hypothetical protein
MSTDPIVLEIRQLREEYSAKFNHDLSAICKDLRAKQQESGRKIVRLAPRCIPQDQLTPTHLQPNEALHRSGVERRP